MFKAHYGKLECYDEGQERAKIKECSSLECDSKITPGFRDHFKRPRHISCTVVTQIVIEYVLCSWVKKNDTLTHEIVTWNSGHVCCAKLLQLCTILCDPVDLRWQDSSAMRLYYQEYWNALLGPLGIAPIQGSNPCLLHILHWQAGSLILVPLGKPKSVIANWFPFSFLVVLDNNRWTVSSL